MLNLTRRTIQRYIKRRNFLDENIENYQVNIFQLPQKDRIFEDVGRQVIEYWTSQSRVSSNRKDTTWIKDEETGMKITHPKHFVDTTQSELFEAFRKEFFNLKIFQRMFERLRPCFVRINKVHETCCQNPIEFHLYLQSLRKSMATLESDVIIPKSTIEFVKSLSCDNVEESDEFNVECIKNACTNCGELYKKSYEMDNIDISTLVVWNRSEYEIY